MYFRPATQGKEVEEDDTDQPEYMGSCEEDDILYAGGAETSRGRRDDTFIYSPIGAATRNTEEVAKSKFEKVYQEQLY